MPIYGNSKRVVNEHSLLEMSEVTFHVPLADIRRIARFLNHAADAMEAGEWRSDHLHMIDVDLAWDADHPQSDVIVIHPDPAPLKHVV